MLVNNTDREVDLSRIVAILRRYGTPQAMLHHAKDQVEVEIDGRQPNVAMRLATFIVMTYGRIELDWVV